MRGGGWGGASVSRRRNTVPSAARPTAILPRRLEARHHTELTSKMSKPSPSHYSNSGRGREVGPNGHAPAHEIAPLGGVVRVEPLWRLGGIGRGQGLSAEAPTASRREGGGL